MQVDVEKLKAAYLNSQSARNGAEGRDFSTVPRLFDYDYLMRSHLKADIETLLSGAPAGKSLDVGAGQSPYRAGRSFETLDTDASLKPDHLGTIEDADLPATSYDLILCTQVLEHCRDPRVIMREIQRLLKKGGETVLSAPLVWFYHPHPNDYWRFTAEGLKQLCTDAGLNVIEMRSQGGSAACLFQVVNFALYGVIGRAGAPLYVLGNLLGRALDAVFPNSYFCLNFCCRAVKS